MKNLFNKILFLILFIPILISCQKDDEHTPVTKEQMIAKKWMVHQVFVNSSLDNTTDYSGFSYQFNSDGTYNINTNGANQTGTWELNSNETVILLNKGTVDEKTIEVFKLEENQLVIEILIPATWKENEKIMRIVLSR